MNASSTSIRASAVAGETRAARSSSRARQHGALAATTKGEPSAAAPSIIAIKLACLLLVASACYLNALEGAFLFDDVAAIVNNPLVRRVEVARIFSSASWWAGSQVAVFRPLTTLTFAMNASVGGLDPLGYHLVNTALHAIVCLLLLVVLTRLTGEPRASFIAALLFAAHPVHTEAVASIVGRAELLAAGFGLAAWWWALRGGPGQMGRWYGVAGVILAAGVLAKENAASLAAVVPVADLICRRADASPREVLRARLALYLALAVGAGAALALRIAVVGGLSASPPMLDNLLPYLAWGSRLMTTVKVIGLYARVLIWPFALSADYSYPQIGAVRSVLEPGFLCGLGVVIAATSAAIWGWRRDRHVIFAVAFAGLVFAPVSNLVVPIGTVMAERLLYLPSAGFCLLVALALARLPLRASHAVTAGLVVLCGAGTMMRNQVWREPDVFFETMVATAPRSARSHRELGIVQSAGGRHESALAQLDEAVRLYPDEPVTWYTLGNALVRAGRGEQAADAYTHALRLKPDYGAAMLNLGNVYSTRGDESAAEQWFRRGMALEPGDSDFPTNLANSLLRQGRTREVEDMYQEAIRRAPTALAPRVNFGTFLLQQGRPSAAVEQYRAAASIAPDVVDTWMGLIVALQGSGRNADARAAQREAERRFPNHAAVWQIRTELERAGSGGD